MRGRADLAPGEPALFFREGWDWRWRTWQQLAEAVDAAGAGACIAAPNEMPEVAALVELLAADRAGRDAGPDVDLACGLAARDWLAGLPPFPLASRWRRWSRVPNREVVVEALQDRDPFRVLWLRWAIANGAAVVLAPSPASWLEVVLFARPTVLWGGATEAAALLERLRGRRRLVDRLRAFAWLDATPVPAEVTSAWHELEVAILGRGDCG